MLELLKFFFEKLDFFAISAELKKRHHQRIAARLYVILVQAYEIIELCRILLDELSAALDSHQRQEDSHRFRLNPSRIAFLLSRQASNLVVMETMTSDLIDELRILDNSFAQAFRDLVPGKQGILFEAQCLLEEGRLPLAETGPEKFPENGRGEYRTLWFSHREPSEARQEEISSAYLQDTRGRSVIDVNLHDGDAFFQELDRYFREENPLERTRALEALADRYKGALLQNFKLEDLIGDIGKIRRHVSWAP